MKKNKLSFVAALITLSLAGGAASTAGCGGVSTPSLCEDVCACQGCTSNDLQTCEDQAQHTADAAEADGCSSEFDELVTCFSAHVSCKNDQAVTDGCDAEISALSKCSGTTPVPAKSPCEQAADQISAKLASCPKPPTVTSGGGGGMTECSDSAGILLLCQASAFVQASCDCIGAGDTTQCTAEQAKAFTDAFVDCK
jgi:hypothetical protein